MIEHVFTWTCDYPGCGQEQVARVWVNDATRTASPGPMEGWMTIQNGDETRHYCRECGKKIKGGGNG